MNSVTGPDVRAYDYTNPTRLCDVVMKGGITSGVIYPHAVCEFAPAVTASATSAAHRRARSSLPRRRLSTVGHRRPVDSGGSPSCRRGWAPGQLNLFDLFQPQPATRTLYGLLAACMQHEWKLVPRAAGLVSNARTGQRQ